MLLKDKVAVITGGAGLNGLGYATARQMAQQGAKIVILDLERANPVQAAASLGEDHLGLVADVTDKASCEAAIATALQTFGRIDVLMNNAGITQPVKTLDIGGVDYDLQISKTKPDLIAAEMLVRPTLIIGQRVANNLITEAERFRIGRALFLLRENALVLRDLSVRDIRHLFVALGRSDGNRYLGEFNRLRPGCWLRDRRHKKSDPALWAEGRY